MSMTIEEIIAQLENEVVAIQEKMNTMTPVTCPHQLCPECAKRAVEQQKEGEMLSAQLNEKIELINNLKATQ